MNFFIGGSSYMIFFPKAHGSDDGASPLEKDLSERLKLRGRTHRLMRQLRMAKGRLPPLTDPQQPPSTIVALLDQAQPAALLLLSVLEENPLLGERVQCYTQTWRHIHPSLDGRDLRQLGLPPGPDYGHILRRLRGALLDGEIEAGAAELELAKVDHTQ